jgi:two-component sensor histidine kinase
MSILQTLGRAWRNWWSPYFRDSHGQPVWADLAVTFLFSTAIALVLTAFSWVFSGGRVDVSRALWMNLVVAQCIGFSIHGLFTLAAVAIGAERIDSWRGPRRALFFSLIPLAGATIGYALGFTLLSLTAGGLSFRWLTGWFVAGVLMIWAVMSVIWWRFYHHKVKLAEAEQQLAVDRARAAMLERQALDAQLRSLQAQIEPHFLFNTLANVVSLIDRQPADARRMLERLIELLRASLSASRSQQSTLGQEIDLVRTYLDILAIRMAGRLRYEIDVEPALRAYPLAPLLLQPLVENAIQHGLEPKLEGGHVRVVARAEGDVTEIVIEDDGLGFGATTRGGGVGLSNLRERLAALFAGAARLTIEDAQPGTRVRLRLPASGPVSPATLTAPLVPAT